MQFFSRKIILAFFVLSVVPWTFTQKSLANQDLKDLLALDDPRNQEQNISRPQLSGCWDALTIASTAVFCINFDLVAAAYFYPNEKATGDENVCHQRGEIEYISPKTMIISLIPGDCFGSNILPAMQMDCELLGQTLTCNVKNVDLEDASAADIPPLKFEPIGRKLK